MILATVAAGFGLGLALGLSGVGGGVVLTPLLILWLRLPATFAVGTSVAFSLVTKLVGGVQHLRQGTVDRSTVAWLAAGSMPSALLTSLAANTWGRRLLSEATTQRLVAGAVLLCAVVMTLRLVGVVKPLHRRPARVTLIPLGMALGAVFALTSVGSGSIAVAALVVLTPLAIAPLIGTDVTHAALMAAVTAPVYLAGGRVDVPVLLPLLVGSLPGVLLGSRLAARLPEPVIKGTVLVAVWAIAVRLI
jgi:uncharacterized membrane protein YfcA